MWKYAIDFIPIESWRNVLCFLWHCHQGFSQVLRACEAGGGEGGGGGGSSKYDRGEEGLKSKHGASLKYCQKMPLKEFIW